MLNNKIVVSETKDGVILRVVIKTDRPKTSFQVEEDAIIIEVNEPPIMGRANAAMKKLLANNLRVKTSNIEIVRGVRNKLKYVLIRGLKSEDILEKLRVLNNKS